ncbi:LytR C-terminal domain-containing protein [Tessaracoccus sp. G1721]
MRIFRLIATPILLLGLLGLLLWGASWGWKALTEPLPTPSPTPCVMAPAEIVTVPDVTVRVYNGGFTSGLASRVSAQLETAGFNVIKVDNTEERIKGTVIRANRQETPQIRLAASYFLDPVIEYDDRVDGVVDIYVGTDFAGFGPEPFSQVSADGGQVCRVPSPSPSASPSPAAPSPAATP